MKQGISWQSAVRIARDVGWIEVNLHDMRPMTRAVKRAWNRKALIRVPSPNGRAVFKVATPPAAPGGQDGE